MPSSSLLLPASVSIALLRFNCTLTLRSARRAIPQARQRSWRHATAAVLLVSVLLMRVYSVINLHTPRYCLIGIAVLAAGVVYWAGWRIILPKVFGYELIPRKETLPDGTVITLVSCVVDPGGKHPPYESLVQFSRRKIQKQA